jgi:CheY-like chemotaxis protein
LEEQNPAMNSLRVIIIDDDPITVWLHQLFVKQSELSTDPLVFLNGLEALHHLDSLDHLNSRSLLLLDLNMPNMNGWEILEALNMRSYAGQVFAIIISSSIDTKDHKKAKTYKQVIGYLEKPIKVNELRNVMLPDVQA